MIVIVMVTVAAPISLFFQIKKIPEVYPKSICTINNSFILRFRLCLSGQLSSAFFVNTDYIGPIDGLTHCTLDKNDSGIIDNNFKMIFLIEKELSFCRMFLWYCSIRCVFRWLTIGLDDNFVFDRHKAIIYASDKSA